LTVLERHPEVPQAVIDYRELVAHPKHTIESVCELLGVHLNEAARERLAARERRAREHKTTHSYSLEEFGLDQQFIRRELSELFERYGWDESNSPGEETLA
jgi:hypothetical protein